MKMTDEELKNFIEGIGRSELYDEKELNRLLRKCNQEDFLEICNNPARYSLGSIYRKAIEATLYALGYDQDWVYDNVSSAFYNRYYPKIIEEMTEKEEIAIEKEFKDYGKIIDNPNKEQ